MGLLPAVTAGALCLVAAAAGCTSNGVVSHDSPAPASSPTVGTPGGGLSGLLNVTRCKAYRAQIQSNVQARVADAAAGRSPEPDQLQRRINAAVKSAQAIPGCDVSDLPAN